MTRAEVVERDAKALLDVVADLLLERLVVDDRFALGHLDDEVGLVEAVLREVDLDEPIHRGAVAEHVRADVQEVALVHELGRQARDRAERRASAGVLELVQEPQRLRRREHLVRRRHPRGTARKDLPRERRAVVEIDDGLEVRDDEIVLRDLLQRLVRVTPRRAFCFGGSHGVRHPRSFG